MSSYTMPSLNARQDILVSEIPKLGAEAAEKAIREWGQPRSRITHLIFCTNGGVDLPGADYRLACLLGLLPSVHRVMLYYPGCYGGGTVLRLAKDLAENNAGARVLAVCSEITVTLFRGPTDAHPENLVGQALFGDGAAAVLVGSDPIPGVERPLFQMVVAAQDFLPGSDKVIAGQLREIGLDFQLGKEIPDLIAGNLRRILEAACRPVGISDWNSMFWAVHPGGRAVLDRVEEEMGLEGGRLRWSRQVLREYGNMLSACVLFVLDEVRKGSERGGLGSTGEGRDWGVLLGFGPGVTLETLLLRSMPILPPILPN